MQARWQTLADLTKIPTSNTVLIRKVRLGG
jgi:hypothetical protein